MKHTEAKKLYEQAMLDLKAEVKAMYLAGDTIQQISDITGKAPRTLYYHLQPLTAEDKAKHARQQALRKE